MDRILSRLVPGFDRRLFNCRLHSDLSATQSMQKAKPREHRVVLELSCISCRNCLLSPSHCQLAGWLRFSSVTGPKEKPIWVAGYSPRRCYRLVFLERREYSSHIPEPDELRRVQNGL